MQIGNAVINDETDSRGMYDFLASHAIISDETANTIIKHCDFSSNTDTYSDECNDATGEAERDTDHINIYNIYAPNCVSSNLTARPKKASVSSSKHKPHFSWDFFTFY